MSKKKSLAASVPIARLNREVDWNKVELTYLISEPLLLLKGNWTAES